jgi:hypothetical protein
MSLPVEKACIFCGGEYKEVPLPKDLGEGYQMTVLVIGKLGTSSVILGRSLVLSCTKCGNIQAFLEKQPLV